MKRNSQVENVGYYKPVRYTSLHRLSHGAEKMHGVKRVIVFCLLTAILPVALIVLPLYLRHSVFADVTYAVAESDIIEIRDGVSSLFCQKHSLRMNTSFNAFQLSKMPEISENRKHIRLKKSMTLPDDTLEYWGFYLLKGAEVELRVCSKYDGSRMIVVKDEKNLRTCGLLEPTLSKVNPQLAKNQPQVLITYETNAELVVDTKRKKGEELYDHASEDYSEDDDEDLAPLKKKLEFADDYIKKHPKNAHKKFSTDSESNLNDESMKRKTDDADDTAKVYNESELKAKKRHRRHHHGHHNGKHKMKKREIVLDSKIYHGGNAKNITAPPDSSVSSFENNVMNCYNGIILANATIHSNHECTSVDFFKKGKINHATYKVLLDGYYYFIFYSDNDFVNNDIHAVFDIHKPTLQYRNNASLDDCLNSTYCSFDIPFWSNEMVIVEIPTRDGIEHEADDITHLVSTCHPRMGVYIIFPIAVMFLILTCAFL